MSYAPGVADCIRVRLDRDPINGTSQQLGDLEFKDKGAKFTITLDSGTYSVYVQEQK
jgi:hypothetical protein